MDSIALLEKLCETGHWSHIKKIDHIIVWIPSAIKVKGDVYLPVASDSTLTLTLYLIMVNCGN